MDQETETISIHLKWAKKSFTLEIKDGDSGRSLKEKVKDETNVKVERQKILCQKKKSQPCWKGSLADDFVFSSDSEKVLFLTLIGSAEKIAEPPSTRIKFIEDMTKEQLRQVEEETLKEASKDAVGMIPALQKLPHLRDDGKQEMYQYNRLVTGLPQRQIEDILKQQNGASNPLVGKVAMAMGLELRRAYINDFAVLKDDGTLISALDDGHIQIWRHGELQHDVIHGGNDGGVDSVLSLNRNGMLETQNIAFCTAGRGSYKFWTKTGREVKSLYTPVGGTSPTALVQVPVSESTGSSIQESQLVCIVARLKVTVQTNPSQFRLVPQDEEGRQRRALAEAQESRRQELMMQMKTSVQVICGNRDSLSSYILRPHDNDAAPITCLTALSITKKESILVCGDLRGGLRVWKPQVTRREAESDKVGFLEQVFIRLAPEDNQTKNCSIVCMEPLGDGRHLAVSTDYNRDTQLSTNPGNTDIPFSRAVYIIDMLKLLESGSIDMDTTQILCGHDSDAVECMCALPNGGLLTGGGKLDAKLLLWKQSQLVSDGDSKRPLQAEAAQDLSSACGYVFALDILHDLKPGSSQFAIAAGRYNVVKILL